jgi:hypothetical protein
MTFRTPEKDVQFMARFGSIFARFSPDELLAEFEAHSQPRALLEPSMSQPLSQPLSQPQAWTVSAKEVRVTTCNIKVQSVTAFCDCNCGGRTGDAASRRGEEIDCNITSTL